MSSANTGSTPSPDTAASAPTTATQRNNRQPYRRSGNQQTNNARTRFVPKLSTIETLDSSSNIKNQDFTKFQKSIHHHVLTTFKNSKDMSKAILEFDDPFTALRQDRRTISQVRIVNGLILTPPPATESTAEQLVRESDNADKNEMIKILYNTEVKLYAERERDLTQNLTILWATITGQCTPALLEEISGEPDYITKSAAFDGVWLLETIQKVTAGANKTTNKFSSAYKAAKRFYSTHQSPTEGVDEYYNRFETAKDLVVLFNADVVDITALHAMEVNFNVYATKEETLQKFFAVALILNANKARYESLWDKLENDLLMGQDSYPVTIGAALHLLTNWKQPAQQTATQRNSGSNIRDNASGTRPNPVTFAQIPIPANDDFSSLPGYDPARPTMAPSRKSPHNISEHITCTRCGKMGHYATACPFIVPNAPQLMQYARPQVLLNQSGPNDILGPGVIIVDSGSTFNCFRDPELLSQIQPSSPFTTFSNGGGMTYHHVACVNMFPALDCHYNPNCLANIISLDLLQEKYSVAFISEKSNSFTVTISEDNVVTFQGYGSGLYFVKVTPISAYSLLNTVEENKSFYTRREIEGAERAREQQGQIGWPSDQEYYEIVRDNLIRNSKATLDDIQRAKHIFGGTAVNLLKGKSTYRPVKLHEPIERVPLPPIILKTHPTDTMDIDFMYVQGAPYLLMKLENIKFHAVQSFNRISKRHPKSGRITYKRGPKAIINGVTKVIETIQHRGFTLDMVRADNEFEKIENKIPVHLEICAARQHIPRIERAIRFVKERTRCFWVPLPFKKVPKLMVDECITMVISCTNDLPHKNGISQTMSPGSIILGRGKMDGNHLKGTFGRYYEVYSGTDNTNKERRVSAICLRPSNSQGGYYFMSIETGKRIHGYRFTELAMPQYVIDRVHQLATSEDAPNLDDDGCPIFEWEIGTPVRPENDDNVNMDESDSESDDNSINSDGENSMNSDDDDDGSDDDDSDDDSDDSDDDSTSAEDNPPPDNESNGWEADDIEHVEVRSGEDDSSDDETTSEVRSESTTNRAKSENRSVSSEEDLDSDSDDSIPPINEIRGDVDLSNVVDGRRQRTTAPHPNVSSFGGKSYNINMMNIGQSQYEQFTSQRQNILSKSVGVCFNQMTANKGIKLFGEKAIAAMFKEYKQLNDLSVLGRLDPTTLSSEQKKKSLRAINLIKEKRCGKIKGRTCADGSSHRNYVPREEAASPTLSLEALMALLLINSHEGREVAIFDIPGAYLHADIPDDKFVILKIEGAFADIMCDVNPEYKEDIQYESGKKVLYVQILKALYGMIESALLWYQLYSDVLQKEGFEINPYDKCVANKMINGKQCTIGWYVDDNMLSHVDPTVVDSVIEMMEGYFPGLVIERGTKLNFLGMELDFFEKRKLTVGLVQYLTGMIEDFESAILPFKENLDRDYPHPAARWLFDVKPEAKLLCKTKTELYTQYVPKLLWAMKRARPDIEPTVSFLITRLKAPTCDDWHKLKRVMCWIKKTREDVRIIGADDLLRMVVLIDSAHAVHDDMRGHTGGVISFGTGVVDQKSSKQKMNTRSSTESEHVGTSEYLQKPIFFELFMSAQGYKPQMTLGKDNESEIRMLLNGKSSCTSNSRHVAIKYFWTTDRIKAGNIDVRHCATERMVADFMSKAVQGKQFILFRNVIMGWSHMSSLFDPFGETEERVADSTNLAKLKPHQKRIGRCCTPKQQR